MEDRRFSEEEAKALLLAAAGRSDPEGEGGVSFEDLKRIAGELGIDQSDLLSVVREGTVVERELVKREDFFFGRSFVEEYEAVVQRELEPGQLDVVLDELTASRKPLISDSLVQGCFDAGLAVGKVTVSIRDGGTRIRVRSSAWGLALIWFFVCWIVLMSIVLQLIWEPETWGGRVLPIMVVTVVLAVGGVWGMLPFAHRMVHRRFRRLVGNVGERARLR